MQKENKNISTLVGRYAKTKTFQVLFGVLCVGLFALTVFADDIITYIANQSATSPGSNNSIVTFSVDTSTGATYYVNQGGNSTVLGNYFKGYYYNDKMGYFKLDWSNDPSENVRFISSTEKCGNSYGYKLGGSAYSSYFGFVDFDFDATNFVYYCEGDNRLHGYAYSEFAGFQNFDGIAFALSSTGGLLGNTNSNLFVNDTTNIDTRKIYTGSDSNLSSGIGGDIFNIDDTKESIIYIIR